MVLLVNTRELCILIIKGCAYKTIRYLYNGKVYLVKIRQRLKTCFAKIIIYQCFCLVIITSCLYEYDLVVTALKI